MHQLILSRPALNTGFEFAGIIRELIVRAKFMPCELSARALIKQFAHFVRQEHILLPSHGVEAIVYIPLHWRRLYNRGFDLSLLFAMEVSNLLQKPLLHLVHNARFTPPLSLAADIQERVQLTLHRFEVRPSEAKHLLLLDDVRATGSTLSQATQLLQEQGHNVSSFTLASPKASEPDKTFLQGH